ncbi:MAG: DNA-binding response regulator [Alphaproteobacteria bacterium]|nr:response regulator transcription factor [Alphaproteobacteria bacterium]TAD92297.1 MAG: DNA-binding response regulator [Alphaproteobacteria bacterium]
MRILIADDHSLFRDGLRHVLSGLDGQLEILEAGSLPEALSTLEAEDPFDLVILDLAMPGMIGPASLAEVRRLVTDAPVVVISASEDSQDIRAALEAGAAGYIPKSVRGNVMLQALQLVITGSVYIRPSGTEFQARANLIRTDDGFSARIRALLTDRQMDVLRLLAEGKPNKEIARQLNLAEGTVRVHVNAVLKALSARNRTEAALAARTAGLS